MRRLIILSTVAAVVVALAAGAAYAGGYFLQCTSVPCIATGDDDLVKERRGNGLRDDIIMKGGDDRIEANGYGNDTDAVNGGTGYDAIFVNDGDTRDSVSSGTSRGGSICYVDARSEAGAGCGSVRIQPPR